MKAKSSKNSRLPLIVGVAAAMIGFSIGGLAFGALVHESSHAMICLLSGLPYTWSWNQVVFVRSPDNLVNLFVRLAGGIGQAVFSLLFFWCVGALEKGFSVSKSDELRGLVQVIAFGFRLAFLTIALHGVFTALVEGLFHQVYEQIHDNLFVWGITVILFGIVSFRVLNKLPSSE